MSLSNPLILLAVTIRPIHVFSLAFLAFLSANILHPCFWRSCNPRPTLRASIMDGSVTPGMNFLLLRLCHWCSYGVLPSLRAGTFLPPFNIFNGHSCPLSTNTLLSSQMTFKCPSACCPPEVYADFMSHVWIIYCSHFYPYKTLHPLSSNSIRPMLLQPMSQHWSPPVLPQHWWPSGKKGSIWVMLFAIYCKQVNCYLWQHIRVRYMIFSFLIAYIVTSL